MSFTTKNRRPQRYQTEITGGHDLQTLTGTLDLDDDSANVQIVDPGASPRDIKMPASNREGVAFTIVNVGGQLLTLKDSAGSSIVGFGGGASTSTVPSQGRVTVVRTGGIWGHLGVVATSL